MKKKILFVILPYLVKEKVYKLRSFVAFPYGVLSIMSYLKKQAGDKTELKLFDCNFHSKEEYLDELAAAATDFQPDIVGLSMMFDNCFQYLPPVISRIRATKNDSLILLGGAATAATCEDILNEVAGIDAICAGEGELPFLNLINNGERDLIESGSWITRENLNKSPERFEPCIVNNLDDVIEIDYSLVDVAKYEMEEAFSPYTRKENKKQFFIVSTRGCAFKCRFCMNSKNPNKKIRYASVAKVISHVKYLIDTYGMNVLTFYDDQILYDMNRAKELFRQLAQFKLRIEMPNGVSVAFIDDELARLMRSAGVDTLYLAIESGSPRVLNEIIKKPLTISKVYEVVKILQKYNFWLLGYFVVGMPGETDYDRQLTIDLIKETGLDWCSFTAASPVRGSKLYDECLEKGYIDKNALKIGKFEMTRFIINTPEYSAEEIIRKTYLMNLEANFVYNHRMKTGEYELAAKMFKDVFTKHSGHAFAYYCFIKAMRKMNKSEDELKEFRVKLRECLNDTWISYFNHFAIQDYLQ